MKRSRLLLALCLLPTIPVAREQAGANLAQIVNLAEVFNKNNCCHESFCPMHFLMNIETRNVQPVFGSAFFSPEVKRQFTP